MVLEKDICSALIYAIYHYSEVVLGDFIIDTDPDCQYGKKSDGTCLGYTLPSKITRSLEEIVIHEGYKNINGIHINNIALIRLSELVPLFFEDPSLSTAMAVCLPWKEIDFSDVARELKARSILNFIQKLHYLGFHY